MFLNRYFLRSILVLSVCSLAACGGGGSSSPKTSFTPTTPTIPTVTTIEPSIIQIDDVLTVGQSTELILFAPDHEVSNIQWSQTSGEVITFYAAQSKVIGFSPILAGDYSFQVIYTEDNSTEKTLTYDFSVEEVDSLLTARIGHVVIEGSGVSLISYASTNIDGDSVNTDSLRWTQTEGPSVTYTDDDTNGKVAVFFDAPDVEKDTVLRFNVSGTVNGDSVSDDIAILVEHTAQSIETDYRYAPFNEQVADVFLYNSDSPAGQKLIDCVYSTKARYSNSCNFNQTPLIAHVSDSPTVDEIMDRVVISHQWMGDQFKQFLETYDNEHNDFKNLLRATTAIVISYDIRPSFYHPYTGAIYLDPSDLWETPEQRDTINQAPDYRAAFGSDLQFEIPWRYVKNNEYANYYSPISYRLSRTLSSSLYDFASLLYHELAHANDYFPSESWDGFNGTETFLTVVNDLFNNSAIQSDDLQRALPLDENWATGGQNELTKLGQVRFQGESANDTQKAYTMEDVANMFKTEGAPQFYSYSSTREDYAILFDAFMMHARYDVSRDVAVSDQNYDQIVWGQRGREGETQIKPRVKFVTERVLPEYTEAASIIDNLPAPQPFDPNKSWRDNLIMQETVEVDTKGLAANLMKLTKKVDSRLIPKDGEARHGSGRKFVY